MKKCLKNYITTFTSAEYAELQQYLVDYNKCKNIFYNLYWNRLDLIHLPYKHELRDRMVAELKMGDCPPNISKILNRVPAKMQKCALYEAVSNLKSNQTNIKLSIKSQIYKNDNISDRDKHYIRYILMSIPNIHRLNMGKRIEFIDKFDDVDQKKLNSYIRRLLKANKFNKPFATGKSYTLDGSSQLDQERINGQLYINLPTSTKKIRRKFKVTNNDLIITGNVKIVLNESRIEIHKAVDVAPVPIVGTSVIGLYVDFNNLFYTSTGRIYGKNLINILKKYTSVVYNKYETRTLLRNINKPTIFKNNLGTKKQNKFKLKICSELEGYINECINNLIDTENPHTIVMQPVNKYIVYNNRSMLDDINIRYIQKLNNYLIKYITTRLEYKLKLKCINLVIVNSSCTMKRCYNCGSLRTKIADGSFECLDCTVSTNRISNTLCNILSRYGDSDIKLNMSYKDVSRLLERRYQAGSGLT